MTLSHTPNPISQVTFLSHCPAGLYLSSPLRPAIIVRTYLSRSPPLEGAGVAAVLLDSNELDELPNNANTSEGGGDAACRRVCPPSIAAFPTSFSDFNSSRFRGVPVLLPTTNTGAEEVGEGLRWTAVRWFDGKDGGPRETNGRG